MAASPRFVPPPAEYTLDLGDLSPNATWNGAIRIPNRLVAGGGTGYLRRVSVTGGSSPALVFTVGPTDSVPQPHLTDDHGQQLISAWETYAEAVVLGDADGNSVTLKGPDHADNTNNDDNNPYFWTTDNAAALDTFWSRDKTGVTITLQAPLSPLFPFDFGPAQTWVPGDAITPITVPEADGFPDPAYAAAGVPDGVQFDATTRRLTGAPSGPGTGTITVTATNASGSDTWTLDYVIVVLNVTAPRAVDTAPSPRFVTKILNATPARAADSAPSPRFVTKILYATPARAVDSASAEVLPPNFLETTPALAADRAPAARIVPALRTTPALAADRASKPLILETDLNVRTTRAVDRAPAARIVPALRTTPALAADRAPAAGVVPALRSTPAQATDRAPAAGVVPALRSTPAQATDRAPAARVVPALRATQVTAQDIGRTPFVVGVLLEATTARAVDSGSNGRLVPALDVTATRGSGRGRGWPIDAGLAGHVGAGGGCNRRVAAPCSGSEGDTGAYHRRDAGRVFFSARVPVRASSSGRRSWAWPTRRGSWWAPTPTKRPPIP